MNIYGVGTELFCDWFFGGKPSAVCVAILEPGYGDGRRVPVPGQLQGSPGRILVKLTSGPCKGQNREISAFTAVPCKQEFKSGFHRMVNTQYLWQNKTQ
jgi:hypothetical protein